MRLTVTTEISASPERVWDILTDTARYPDWNPLVRRIDGELLVGARPRITVHPPGTWGRTSRPTVIVVEPSRRLAWRGTVVHPLLLEAVHSFTLEPTGRGVRFVHAESFRGILTYVFRRRIEVHIRRGFAEMNEALRVRAEGAS